VSTSPSVASWIAPATSFRAADLTRRPRRQLTFKPLGSLLPRTILDGPCDKLSRRRPEKRRAALQAVFPTVNIRYYCSLPGGVCQELFSKANSQGRERRWKEAGGWRIRRDVFCRDVCAPPMGRRHAKKRHVCATREGDRRQAADVMFCQELWAPPGASLFE
jgi:hypothetical protein